jgi:cell division protein FtsB
MTMIDEIAKLEEEIEQRKAKIKSIKEDGRSEMLEYYCRSARGIP